MSTKAKGSYQFGPFRILADKRVLLRDGDVVSLSPKAFDVLLLLVEHHGEALDKDRLMEELWPESDVEESNLAQHVSALRKALGESPSERRYITTIPGRGYKFAADVTEVGGEPSEIVSERYATVPVEEKGDKKDEGHDAEQSDTVTRADASLLIPDPLPTPFPISRSPRSRLWIALAAVLFSTAGFFAYRTLLSRGGEIESIAVLPFRNESGNADVEYLSDGMTETLINNLSRLPHLSVKARSTVFRYKDKEIEPQEVARDLSVQAVLSGRVVQRGGDLTLYLSLVDGRNGNQLWGEEYNRKHADLVVLQGEIARDVSQKLRVRLSGADERKLTKNNGQNVEAYELYLRGRYHLLKTTRPEFQKAISSFQQAVEKDPAYALAYAGLADAYRSLAVAGETPSTEVMPAAKAAGQKALEIDDTLPEAHAILGYIIFWYDWDWAAAENRLKRALELDPNSAESHLFYAHLLSNLGRHLEALPMVRRARELDPLHLRINALEGQFLFHAGRTDEALNRLQKALELDSNYWPPHTFAVNVYVHKGMFAEAVAEGRKAVELSGDNTQPMAFLGYALGAWGKRAEARSLLHELLKSANDRYVSAYTIAMIYNGLGEHDEALAWLQRAYEQRNVRMTFLKVEPNWNSLRGDSRFQDLIRRVGFEP
jgi:DNA-binding winged helix-turn-helix (wHTH) protein/TolB-like protein/Tfp pilus assembly protein PilF